MVSRLPSCWSSKYAANCQWWNHWTSLHAGRWPLPVISATISFSSLKQSWWSYGSSILFSFMHQQHWHLLVTSGCYATLLLWMMAASWYEISFSSNFLESRNLILPSFHSMCRITFMMFMSITLCASRNAYVFLKMLEYVSIISRIKLLLGQTCTICWMCLYLQLENVCIPHTSWTNISSKEMHRFVKGHWEILKMVQVCHQFRILWEQKCCLVDTWFDLVRVAALLSIL